MILYTCLLSLLVILIFAFLWRKRNNKYLLAKSAQNTLNEGFSSAHHKWQECTKAGLYYCNICSKIMGGFCSRKTLECKKCGILAHNFCSKMSSKLKCKHIIATKDTAFSPHQWVDGNLPVNSVCVSCELLCTNYYALEGSVCIWCQRVVHMECREKINETCDFGIFKKVIIGPNEVIMTKKPQRKGSRENLVSSNKWKDKLHLTPSIIEYKINTPEEKIPIIVVINKMSGGQAGDQFMNSFYRYLNPCQVIDLLGEGLERLKIFSTLKDCKIVVGGGDGTVGSVVNYMRKEVPDWTKKNPPVAILPLGTGNDLSRCLGWGGTFANIDIKQFLKEVNNHSHKVLFDRWLVKINSQDKSVPKELYLYNYCGIGLDAKMCLHFHELRKKYPYMFKTRIGNKFIYGHLGTYDFFSGKKSNFCKNLTMYCDDKQIVLNDIENLIFLNINYWGGGVYDVWGDDQDGRENKGLFSESALSDAGSVEAKQTEEKKFSRQSFSDGLIEVIGIKSTLHLGQVQVKFSSPVRVCQGRKITLEFKTSSKQQMHVDGEPFEIDGPFSVELTNIDKVNMLGRSIQSKYIIESKISEVLDWAESTNQINFTQKAILMERFSKTITEKMK